MVIANQIHRLMGRILTIHQLVSRAHIKAELTGGVTAGLRYLLSLSSPSKICKLLRTAHILCRVGRLV
jgi:hypothetical protein